MYSLASSSQISENDLLGYPSMWYIYNDEVKMFDRPFLFLSGAHWSHLSYLKFWLRSELFHKRRCTCWSVPAEHALRANSKPTHCHVFLPCQGYPSHQASLHPGECVCYFKKHVQKFIFTSSTQLFFFFPSQIHSIFPTISFMLSITWFVQRL